VELEGNSLLLEKFIILGSGVIINLGEVKESNKFLRTKIFA